MTAEQRAQRRLHFDAYNKLEIIGPTKCPYDSLLYLSLTNPVLTKEEIELLLHSTSDWEKLFQLALDVADGNGKLRDIHAAEKFFENLVEEARKRHDINNYLAHYALWLNIECCRLGWQIPRGALHCLRKLSRRVSNMMPRRWG